MARPHGTRLVYPHLRRRGMDAFLLLSRTEGIIPAIESSHALAGVRAWARAKVEAEGPFAPGEEPIAIVTVSGRGDKDVDTASRWFGYGHAKLQVTRPQCRPLRRGRPGRERGEVR